MNGRRDTYCYACDELRNATETCTACGSPPWPSGDTAGVYIVEADCGLLKIGYSNAPHRRFVQLCKESPEFLELRIVVTGATRAIERWLHEVFGDVRDPKMARDFGPPNASEWFWPTPALRRLCEGRQFMRDGSPWEMANA